MKKQITQPFSYLIHFYFGWISYLLSWLTIRKYEQITFDREYLERMPQYANAIQNMFVRSPLVILITSLGIISFIFTIFRKQTMKKKIILVCFNLIIVILTSKVLHFVATEYFYYQTSIIEISFKVLVIMVIISLSLKLILMRIVKIHS